MLKTLMGDYPVTKQFRARTDRFAFAEYDKAFALMNSGDCGKVLLRG